nr:uncharacterized protein LOC127302346 isoform X2 [Lolium perenne]
MVDGAGGGGAWRAADASPPEIAGQRPGNGGVREHKTSWPGEGAAPPAPSSMRVAPSFRTPAALQATPPSAAEAPNSFVLRHLCAVPLESAICLPLEDEGKVCGGTSLMFTCHTTLVVGSLHTNSSSILWMPHLSTVTRWIGRGFGSIKDSGTLCLFLLEKAHVKVSLILSMSSLYLGVHLEMIRVFVSPMLLHCQRYKMK